MNRQWRFILGVVIALAIPAVAALGGWQTSAAFAQTNANFQILSPNGTTEVLKYRLEDLQQQGMNVWLTSNVTRPLTVTLFLVDPFSSEGLHLPFETPALTLTTELPAKSTRVVNLRLPVKKDVTPGEYTGRLTAADGEGTVVQQKVSIYAAHPFFPWATLATVFGVFGSWLVTRYNEHKPKKALQDRRDALNQAIKKDYDDFKAKYPNEPYVGFSMVESAGQRLDGLTLLIQQGKSDEVIEELRNTKKWFDDFRVFRWEQVVRLAEQFEALKKLIEDNKESENPRCLARIEQDLPGGIVEDTAHLTIWKTRLQDWAALLDEWKPVFVEMTVAEKLLRNLKDNVNQADEAKYDQCAKSITDARQVLWRAASKQELAANDVAKSVKDSLSTLRQIPKKDPTRHTPDAKRVQDWTSPFGKLGPKSDGTIQGLGKVAWPLLEGSAITLSLFSAVLAGLLAVYFAQTIVNTFGKPQDYIAALLWGFGVDRALTGILGLTSILEKLGIKKKE